MGEIKRRPPPYIAYKYFVGRRIHHLVDQGMTPQQAMKKAASEWRQQLEWSKNPAKVWHEKRYKQLLTPARDYTKPPESTYYKAQLAEEDYALYQYRKRNPMKKFPFLGLALIGGLAYLIWKNRTQ